MNKVIEQIGAKIREIEQMSFVSYEKNLHMFGKREGLSEALAIAYGEAAKPFDVQQEYILILLDKNANRICVEHKQSPLVYGEGNKYTKDGIVYRFNDRKEVFGVKLIIMMDDSAYDYEEESDIHA